MKYKVEDFRNDIKVGDNVVVIDDGKQYTYYDLWVQKNCQTYSKNFKCGRDVRESEKGTVVCVEVHGDQFDLLFGVLCGERLFVIGMGGIKLDDDFSVELL